MNCIHCDAIIIERRDKPGFVNECEDCAVDVPRVGGNMIFLHKTGPYIEIKPMEQARRFASKTRRFGAGVTASIVQGQITGMERESLGANSQAAPGAQYVSTLSENTH